VATEVTDAGANGVALAVEVDVTTLRAVTLNRMTGCALGLIADKQDVMPSVAKHRLEVVDDAPAGARAIAGNDNGGTGTAGKVRDEPLRVVVGVVRDRLLGLGGMSTGLCPAQGLVIARRSQLPIGCGETRRQGRVENDRQPRPIIWSAPQTLKFLAR